MKQNRAYKLICRIAHPDRRDDYDENDVDDNDDDDDDEHHSSTLTRSNECDVVAESFDSAARERTATQNYESKHSHTHCIRLKVS